MIIPADPTGKTTEEDRKKAEAILDELAKAGDEQFVSRGYSYHFMAASEFSKALAQARAEGRAERPENVHSCNAEVIDGLQAEIKKLTEERDLAVAHDRQPYPTAEAYERTCQLLRKERTRREEAEKEAQVLMDAGDLMHHWITNHAAGAVYEVSGAHAWDSDVEAYRAKRKGEKG